MIANYTYAKDEDGNKTFFTDATITKSLVAYEDQQLVHYDATGIENQYNTVIEHRKVMINGQIFILRGDKTYTLQGQEVK